ncbi:GNAT family N-acetyltransferase [Humisphaera borealis]|uniref:GNAT family N-acetyltransferase n=1 Tax=Humisphaera borealis TaxID=2807512 RepID=A0A7M2WWS1_9BACT|nr:GNAT family N-acetyltransferase [Humisphaera borealis]QOV89281.1 GNAT family N-acetyltransferase [Humisphaera borealis]
MALPVIPQHALTSDQDLLRLYQRTERLWAEHLGEIEQLDVGVAVSNPQLPNVHDANRLLEATLQPGQSPQEAFDEVRRHFDRCGTRCWYWQMGVAAGVQARIPATALESPGPHDEAAGALPAYLAKRGYHRTTEDVMALTGRSGRADQDARDDARDHGGISILPARAAFRQARELAEEPDSWNPEPTLADAGMLHLDDPRCDALLAMRNGRAVGRVTVFAVGEVGRIDQVYVSASARRQGIGRLLITRALEICARSLFKHVMLSVDPSNAAAISLYNSFGFRRIGEQVNWRASVTRVSNPC